jgi:hypothetical protein
MALVWKGFDCVWSILQVQQKIKQGSAVKRAIAGFFFAVSQKYIRAKRVVDGVALEFARTSRPLGALLLAIITCLVLQPFHLYVPMGVGNYDLRSCPKCVNR